MRNCCLITLHLHNLKSVFFLNYKFTILKPRKPFYNLHFIYETEQLKSNFYCLKVNSKSVIKN